MVSLFYYKYNFSCLASTESGQFCLMEEQTWNITALNISGEATWPAYTNKTYPNWILNDDGSPLVDVDDNIVEDPFENNMNDFQYYQTNLDPTGIDYYVNTSNSDFSNYGWDESLEYDEYPLEIQCSSCFINQMIMGIESEWGEVYDEVTEQIWANVENNCNLTRDLSPAHNLTGDFNSVGALTYTTVICDYNITVADVNQTCTGVSLTNNIASASLINLNSVSCSNVSTGTYCSAETCQVVEITEPMSAIQLLSAAEYSNITLTQFASWNPFTTLYGLLEGDVVCIGPPGGAYVPAPTPATQASPTVFTTTATPAAPTISGTVANCGQYYDVQAGDYCDLITLNFTITLAQLLAWNPSLNANCTNLLAGYDYCVALVNGTSATNGSTTTTAPSTSTTTTVSTTHTATSTSTFVPAPTQTVSGTTPDCYEWYTVQSGDSCIPLTIGKVDYGSVLVYDMDQLTLRDWHFMMDEGEWRDVPAYSMDSPENGLYKWMIELLDLQQISNTYGDSFIQKPMTEEEEAQVDYSTWPNMTPGQLASQHAQNEVSRREFALRDIYLSHGWKTGTFADTPADLPMWERLELARQKATENFRHSDFKEAHEALRVSLRDDEELRNQGQVVGALLRQEQEDRMRSLGLHR